MFIMVSLKWNWSLSNRLLQFYLDNYKYSKKQMIFFDRHL